MQQAAVLQMNVQDQFTLPLALQQAMNIKAGDTLLAYLENNHLIIETNQKIKQQLKNRFQHINTQSLADELIDSRRKEALKKQA
ncbi:AbrB/MazE/SpoVT family DNA-binding domain-containing protein [Candidatus Albibeggiatoa sp. nov. BB20]|uniref:AbrB/MazE/SpoVT family DNA-binding domain-containing protein n=1 Tax=Candidatus Albibeggiatoa sp. nov. BB20 TaxID=3162723 RepID=UPI00336591B9